MTIPYYVEMMRVWTPAQMIKNLQWQTTNKRTLRKNMLLCYIVYIAVGIVAR